MAQDSKFYQSWWNEMSEPCCEECGIVLLHFSHTFFAHIIGKRNKSIRHDKRNFVILCQPHHQVLDFGTLEQRQAMKIYDKVETIKQTLKLEQYGSKRANS